MKIEVHTRWCIKHKGYGVITFDRQFFAKRDAQEYIDSKDYYNSYKPVKVYISESDPRKKGN